MESPKLLAVIASVFLGLSMISWAVLVARHRNRGTFLESQPRRDVPWGGHLVTITFVLYIGLQIAAISVAHILVKTLPAGHFLRTAFEGTSGILAVVATAIVLSVTLVLLLLQTKTGTGPADVGLVLRNLPSDLGIGLVAFFAAAPVVYGIQAVLSKFYGRLHPTIEQLIEQDTLPMWFAAGVTAVGVAPVVEELVFRAVLQGWLEKRRRRHVDVISAREAIATAAVCLPRATDSEPQSSISDSAAAKGATDPFSTSYQPPRSLDEAVTSRGMVAFPTAGHEYYRPDRLMYEPIAVTSFVFALFHITHGSAPVALFVLSLVLGYIYQRTHRILPCIAVHMLINGTSIAMLGLGLAE